jgi:hypothetical protein
MRASIAVSEDPAIEDDRLLTFLSNIQMGLPPKTCISFRITPLKNKKRNLAGHKTIIDNSMVIRIQTGYNSIMIRESFVGYDGLIDFAFTPYLLRNLGLACRSVIVIPTNHLKPERHKVSHCCA